MRSTASARREDAWLAGGAVRDLLLGRPTSDLDVVVSGEAGDFADALAAKHGVTARRHARFGTATLTLSTGVRVDVARPRREAYARPGALPSVSFPATLEEDLARRDFTIHAMAFPLRLRHAPRPRLYDPFGGRADLAAKRIRVLHHRSFLDDPTRAYRAVRYASRLGFRVDSSAARLVRAAVAAGAVDAVSGDRLWRELGLIVSEPARAGSAALLSRLGLDAAIAPALSRPGAPARLRATAAAAARLGAHAADPLCYLLACMGDAPQESLVEAADRLALAGRARETWLEWPRTRARGSRFAGLPPAEKMRRTRDLTGDLAAAVAATLPAEDRRAWIAAMRAPRPELRIRGRDLLAAGVPPGPRVGAALARTLEAREEGRIGADQELEFALEAARRGGDAAS